VVRGYQRVILRAAAYYTLSKNSYFMDRILFFLRNLEKNGKTIHKTTLYFLSRGSEDKRFVYSQVCYQTNWLIFRAVRPRDKLPHIKLYERRSPGFSKGIPGSPRHKDVRSITAELAKSVAWIGRPKG
jgi:hypothetical protein